MREIEVRSAGVCVSEGRLLLVNHEKHERSYWVLPGGHVKPGERLDEALRREFQEEVALDISVGPLVLVHDFLTDTRHVVNHVFRVETESAELNVTPQDALKDARWVPLAELDAIDLLPPIAEHIRRVLTHPEAGPVYLGNV